MSKELTSFVVPKSLHMADVAASGASTNTVAISGFGRASFLIDVGPGVYSTDFTSDATLAISIQHSLLDVSSDWAVGVATDISASTPPTTGAITLPSTTDVGTSQLFWIDMNLNALGISTGLLRAYMTASAQTADFPTDFPVGIIALLYGGLGTASNSDVGVIVQSYDAA